MMVTVEEITIAGAGNVAQTMGRLLHERGLRVAAVASRDPAHARRAAEFISAATRAVPYAALAGSSCVLIAVSDQGISPVAEILARSGMSAGVALHTCGARSEDALAPLAERGVSCGTLHPLQTVSSPEQGVRDLPGVAFAVSGAPAALDCAGRIARLLDGRALHVPAAARPAYHAAAVMAGNYLTGLVHAAVILMETAEIPAGEALRALGPLMRTSLENALAQGPAKALTGPIARGDAATVRDHLQALRHAPETVSAFYRAAGLAVLELARGRQLPETACRELREALKGDV